MSKSIFSYLLKRSSVQIVDKHLIHLKINYYIINHNYILKMLEEQHKDYQ